MVFDQNSPNAPVFGVVYSENERELRSYEVKFRNGTGPVLGKIGRLKYEGELDKLLIIRSRGLTKVLTLNKNHPHMHFHPLDFKTTEQHILPPNLENPI